MVDSFKTFKKYDLIILKKTMILSIHSWNKFFYNKNSFSYSVIGILSSYCSGLLLAWRLVPIIPMCLMVLLVLALLQLPESPIWLLGQELVCLVIMILMIFLRKFTGMQLFLLWRQNIDFQKNTVPFVLCIFFYCLYL